MLRRCRHAAHLALTTLAIVVIPGSALAQQEHPAPSMTPEMTHGWEMPLGISHAWTGAGTARMPGHHASQPDDSAAVVAVVERFHGALAAGDSATALQLLADDAIILESGRVESRAEYRAHHLPADIAFARGVRTERAPVQVRVVGDVAWTSSMSTTRGDFNGRQVNSVGAELMVLARTADGWRIRAIHWSTRAR